MCLFLQYKTRFFHFFKKQLMKVNPIANLSGGSVWRRRAKKAQAGRRDELISVLIGRDG